MKIANIILTVLLFIWTIISFIILQKNQKKLEEIKVKNTNKASMTKTWFDTEFQMYKSLFRGIGDVINFLIISKITNSNKRDFHIKYLTLQDELKSSQPFINEKIYDAFDKLLGAIINYNSQQDESTAKKSQNMNDIENMRDNLSRQIKDYLSTLTVV